jgi:glucosyl-dolichyl phosphate glucuronosyltransferase
MTSESVDVSVVICAYAQERWYDLVAAVESIQRQAAAPREVIVVVDHNIKLLERVRVHLPGAIVIENSALPGLSGARNSGIARAAGEYIAFLDDDAAAEPDWLALLSHCFEEPQVLGVGGTVEPEWLSQRPAWFPQEFFWVIGCTYLRSTGKPVIVRNPFGGCTCYRREVFEVVGGFKPEIGRVGRRPMGCEETELCIRAKQHWNEKVFLYEPRARIRHRIPAQRTSWRYFRSRCYAEGLSKALVTCYVGAKDGLASERDYTLRTLPKGVIRGLMDGLLHLDLTGFLRAGAIIAGLMMTIVGYEVGIHIHRSAVARFPKQQAKEITNSINQISVELEQEEIG